MQLLLLQHCITFISIIISISISISISRSRRSEEVWDLGPEGLSLCVAGVAVG